MIKESDAIEIAKKAIVGKVNTHEGEPITVELKEDRFIVTFVHNNPPGVRGADYHAKVAVDVRTGEVLGPITVGP